MKVNTNQWNKLRYTFFTPIYDSIARHFDETRARSIQSIAIKTGDKVLIVGAGTGLDLEYLPKDCKITATDITPSMVEKIKQRASTLNMPVDALIMDGQNLDFGKEEFDVVILHLILAVIPDPKACIKEAERVLKPNGQVLLFDKFLKKGAKASPLRKIINGLTNTFFTDITRSFESIVSVSNLKVVSDIDANFGGHFRLIRLTKL